MTLMRMVELSLARSKAELDLAALEIEHAGGTSLRIRADVRDYEQMAAATDRMRAHFGRLDSVICAAAIQGPIGPFASTEPKAWAETIDTNLLGVIHTCRAALPGMVVAKSRQTAPAHRRRRHPSAPELYGLRCGEDGPSPLRRKPGRGSAGAQRTGELHVARRGLHQHDRRDSARWRLGRLARTGGRGGGKAERRHRAGEATAVGRVSDLGAVEPHQHQPQVTGTFNPAPTGWQCRSNPARWQAFSSERRLSPLSSVSQGCPTPRV